MSGKFRRMLLRLCRVASLLLVSSLGVVALMRSAPGYFDDEREMSPEHGDAVLERLQAQQRQTALEEWAMLVRGAVHGDFGVSRQYGVPVRELVLPRVRTSAYLLVPAVLLGSLLALGMALGSAMAQGQLAHRVGTTASSLFCAVPISVLALFCLVCRMGGAGTVLVALIVSRDFRFFSRLLRHHAAAQHLFFARAGGMPKMRLTLRYLLWPVRREVAALMITSFVVALNALLPLEVIFGLPGIGQLAWSAAMNRDLPVLLMISLLLSLCIGLAGLVNQQPLQDAVA